MSLRQQKLESVLKRALQQVLLKGLADPRMKGSATVTSVRVSQDGRDATVLVSIIPEDTESISMHALRSAERHIRRQAGDLVETRRMPDLHFKLDRGLKEQAEIHELINRASEELRGIDGGASTEDVATESPSETEKETP